MPASLSRLLAAVLVADGAARSVAGFAVGSVAVSARVAGGVSEVAQKIGGAGLSQLGDGVSVGALGGGVDIREADDDAVPPQQFEEAPLPHLVGCVADSVQQLVHTRAPYRPSRTVPLARLPKEPVSKRHRL